MLPAMNGLPFRNGTKKQLPPFPPANFAADFAGGGLMGAFGVVMALYQCQINGKFFFKTLINIILAFTVSKFIQVMYDLNNFIYIKIFYRQ